MPSNFFSAIPECVLLICGEKYHIFAALTINSNFIYMQKLINIQVRTLLKSLHNGEHFRFYDSAIIKTLAPLMTSLPQMSGMYNALKTVFDREDALLKLSQGSILTKDIRFLNGKRSVYYSYLWASVAVFRYENLASNIQQAVETLEFLRNTYKDLLYANYADMSGMMINFLQDCEKPAYKPSIQLLGLTEIVNKIKAAEEEFDTLYDERAFNKEQIADLGKLVEVRPEVDDAFVTLIDAINFTWTANEMGAKDATLRANLIEAKDHIAAAIHQAELVLARRGHHKAKEDDKKDEGAQAPDTTNPPAPETPPQQPDTTNPPAPDTPPQQPDTTIPPINPEDLNPPAAGE
jgi:hypothetical protein